MTAVITGPGALRALLERKKIRALVEETRALSLHQHDGDVADAMLNILEWLRASPDESEENKAIRSAFESLYSVWVERQMPSYVSDKLCTDYLLPPARALLPTPTAAPASAAGNASHRTCALLLGALLSSSTYGALNGPAGANRSGEPVADTTSAVTAAARGFSGLFSRTPAQLSSAGAAASPSASASVGMAPQFLSALCGALPSVLAALSADAVAEARLPSKVRKERALHRLLAAPVLNAVSLLAINTGPPSIGAPPSRLAAADSQAAQLDAAMRFVATRCGRAAGLESGAGSSRGAGAGPGAGASDALSLLPVAHVRDIRTACGRLLSSSALWGLRCWYEASARGSAAAARAGDSGIGQQLGSGVGALAPRAAAAASTAAALVAPAVGSKPAGLQSSGSASGLGLGLDDLFAFATGPAVASTPATMVSSAGVSRAGNSAADSAHGGVADQFGLGVGLGLGLALGAAAHAPSGTGGPLISSSRAAPHSRATIHEQMRLPPAVGQARRGIFCAERKAAIAAASRAAAASAVTACFDAGVVPRLLVVAEWIRLAAPPAWLRPLPSAAVEVAATAADALTQQAAAATALCLRSLSAAAQSAANAAASSARSGTSAAHLQLPAVSPAVTSAAMAGPALDAAASSCLDLLLRSALSETRPALALSAIRELCAPQLGLPALLQHLLVPQLQQAVAAAATAAQASAAGLSCASAAGRRALREKRRLVLLALASATDSACSAISRIACRVGGLLASAHADGNAPLLSACVRTASALGLACARAERSALAAPLAARSVNPRSQTRSAVRGGLAGSQTSTAAPPPPPPLAVLALHLAGGKASLTSSAGLPPLPSLPLPPLSASDALRRVTAFASAQVSAALCEPLLAAHFACAVAATASANGAAAAAGPASASSSGDGSAPPFAPTASAVRLSAIHPLTAPALLACFPGAALAAGFATASQTAAGGMSLSMSLYDCALLPASALQKARATCASLRAALQACSDVSAAANRARVRLAAAAAAASSSRAGGAASAYAYASTAGSGFGMGSVGSSGTTPGPFAHATRLAKLYASRALDLRRELLPALLRPAFDALCGRGSNCGSGSGGWGSLLSSPGPMSAALPVSSLLLPYAPQALQTAAAAAAAARAQPAAVPSIALAAAAAIAQCPSADRAAIRFALARALAGMQLDALPPGLLPFLLPALALSGPAAATSSAAAGWATSDAAAAYSLSRVLAATGPSSASTHAGAAAAIAFSTPAAAAGVFESGAAATAGHRIGKATASQALGQRLSRSARDSAIAAASQALCALLRVDAGAGPAAVALAMPERAAALAVWAAAVNEAHGYAVKAFAASGGYSRPTPSVRKEACMGPWGPHFGRSAGASPLPDTTAALAPQLILAGARYADPADYAVSRAPPRTPASAAVSVQPLAAAARTVAAPASGGASAKSAGAAAAAAAVARTGAGANAGLPVRAGVLQVQAQAQAQWQVRAAGQRFGEAKGTSARLIGAPAAAGRTDDASTLSCLRTLEALRRRRVLLVRSRSRSLNCFGYGYGGGGGGGSSGMGAGAGSAGSSGCASDAEGDVLGTEPEDSFDSAEAAQERTWVRALRASVIVGQAAAAGFGGW